MKFTQKWFLGQCEICTAKDVHVREVSGWNATPDNPHVCEGCEPAQHHWHTGQCEEERCGGTSVRWDALHGMFRCYVHQSDREYHNAKASLKSGASA